MQIFSTRMWAIIRKKDKPGIKPYILPLRKLQIDQRFWSVKEIIAVLGNLDIMIGKDSH